MIRVMLGVVLGVLAMSASAENVPYDQAKKGGLKKCLPAIKDITQFIVDQGESGADSSWDGAKPDSSAFSTAIETNIPDATIFTNIVVAPEPGGKCYVEYEKIVNLDESCEMVSNEMKGAKPLGQLNSQIEMFEQPSGSVYLIPNGDKCTMVRKQVVMHEAVK